MKVSEHFDGSEYFTGVEDYYQTMKAGGVPPQWKISPLLIEAVEMARQRIGSPIIINSAFRTPEHNFNEGGTKYSLHLIGAAADIYCPAEDIDTLYDVIKGIALFKGIGKAKTFIHCDTRASVDVVEWDYD